MFEAKGPCWKGYKQIGMKTKNGKEVPNCVPVNEATAEKEDEFHRKLDKLVHDTFGHSSDEKKKMEENVDNPKIDQIFHPYHGKNIVMNIKPGSDWSKIITKLEALFGDPDEVADFMINDVEYYLQKHNIDLMEPEDMMLQINTDALPHRRSDYDFEKPGPAFEEIKRMQELAGLWEDEDEEEEYEEEEGPEQSDNEIISQDHMLTFNDEDTRDQAIMYFKIPGNQPREVQKYTRGKLQMHPEDAVSIMFPTQANIQSCGLDERKLKGIVEIMHRAINKKYPNSKTIKMETDG